MPPLLSGMAHTIEQLRAWERALTLAVQIHRLTDTHQDTIARIAPGLRQQLRRAVDAIPLLLAEAIGYGAPARAATHVARAISACDELALQLRLALILEAVPSTASTLLDETRAVRAMLTGLRTGWARVRPQRQAPPVA